VRFHAPISHPPPLATVRTPSAAGPGCGYVSVRGTEGDKGTLLVDHVTEDKPIRLAARMLPRPRRGKNEGLRCGRYENIDHIKGLVELRAEYVRNEFEVQLERKPASQLGALSGVAQAVQMLSLEGRT
jgi:hypothetical protein